MRIVREKDRPLVPWKNGLGMTRELWAWPSDEWVWRLSLANITQASDFSSFPGIDRTITVVDGVGMTLFVDGQQHALTCHAQLAFRGESVARCTLLADAPVRDLNLMVRRDRAKGSLAIVTAEGELPMTPEAVAVVVLAGELEAMGERLEPFDALIMGVGDAPRGFAARGRFAVVHVVLAVP